MLKKKLGIEAIEEDWEYDCIYNYYKISSTLIIPDGNKRIGNSAFWGCDWLREVEIPESVKFIGELAFKCCYNLKKVKIPDSVEYIRKYAFARCWDLGEVEIPEGVKEIGYHAFESCRKLEEVEIPESCERIGDYAFEGCISLKRVIIPERVKERVKEYEKCIFFGCKDIDIILRKPESEFKFIGRNALFNYRNVKKETGN